MESLIKEHIEKFGKEPIIIGMFWRNQKLLFSKIANAIDSDTPYSEYEMLSDKDKEAYDKGGLVF